MRFLSATVSILLVLTICLTAVPLGLEAEMATPGVHIIRVCPSYPGEFITISNDGPATDLGGWRLSDGEGSVVLNSPFILRTGEKLSWCESPERFQALYPDELVIHRNSSGLTCSGNLKLADQGDEVSLYDPNGNLVDVVYYGGSEPHPPWVGPAVPCKKGSMLARRTAGMEFRSWGIERPGLYSTRTEPTEAMVTPILYPEEGLSAMLREIDRARESIHMAAYLIENWTLVRHLCAAADRGVQVTLLLEGQPVTGVSENGATIAYCLQEAGAEVWIMRSSNSFRRYDYLHAKYMVFDRERSLVSSENMADSSFSNNRGWAALVHSPTLAEAALEIFGRDISGMNVDVFPLELSLPRSEGRAPRSPWFEPQFTERQVRATVSLASSPYCVYDITLSALDDAQRTICLQQMNVDEGWLEDGDLMLALYRAAGRGVTVRILLDRGLGTAEPNGRTAATLNSMAVRNGWDLECRLTSEASLIERAHNKGVIIDDTVLVGSANWVDGSMERNREMMFMLSSSDLASIYLEWFMDDWKGDPMPPEISLPWHFLETKRGDMVLLDATGCQDPSGIMEFAWDLDGDGITDLFGPAQALVLPVGEHVITLTVTDTLGNAAIDTLTVRVARTEAISSLWIYTPLPAFALVLVLKRFRGRFF